ncbi:hypothetical protein [Opitutus sp. ER46]|uniref:hypothetical protein n=1 Tax=Opitutus sp. ER46 TaxID=2161864 RepID=UPI0011B214FF|nr:hypothetical protein [Opitutus sp. ER46]
MKPSASRVRSAQSLFSPSAHPSPEEIASYAAEIARKEGEPPEQAKVYAREAELQLWVWRTEARRALRHEGHELQLF